MSATKTPTPTYLAEKNPHPRDTQITFDEEPHIYTINGEEDKTYTSVTTWVHSYFKPFNAKEVIKAMMRNKRKWEDPVANQKYYGKSAEEIEEMWSKAGREASEKGTAMHYKIECFYNMPPPDDTEDTPDSEDTDPDNNFRSPNESGGIERSCDAPLASFGIRRTVSSAVGGRTPPPYFTSKYTPPYL